MALPGMKRCTDSPDPSSWWKLASFELPSREGVQLQAAERVTAVLVPLKLPRQRLADLEIAVVEATINALEHGNQFNPEKRVSLEVFSHPTAVVIRIHDQGTSGSILEPPAPDLEAKLAGQQSPRGWGLFLMRSMVDEVHLWSDAHSHTVELVLFHR